MPKNTAKLGIPKPYGDEIVSRAAFNKIWDQLDQMAVREPFLLKSVVYVSSPSKIDVTLGPGVADFLQTIVSKTEDTVYSIVSPAANTTYYVYLKSDGSFTHNTTGAEVDGAVMLWKIGTGATLGTISTTDLRGQVSGSAQMVKDLLDAHAGAGGTAHANAVAGGAAGFMTGTDKAKLDGISNGANRTSASSNNGKVQVDGSDVTVYTHPSGDGNSHVPATGTTNAGKVLKAGATANSAVWGNVDWNELTGKPTTISGAGLTDAATTSYVDSYVGTSPAPTQVTLGYGQQVVTATRTAPLENISIKGRTLVNLLGRDGNCDTTSTFDVYQATIATVPALTDGIYALAVTSSTSSFASAVTKKQYSFKAGKCYVSIASLKSASTVSAGIDFPGLLTYEVPMDGTLKIVGRKFTSATDLTVSMSPFIRANATGQKLIVDSVRVYEIPSVEYDLLPVGTFTVNSTNQWIVAKYPYVDDMKSITNPYVYKYGENLVPPFSEWTISQYATIIEPYKLNIMVPAGVVDYSTSVKIPVLPNTQYTLSALISSPSDETRINYLLYDVNGNAISDNYGFSQGNASGSLTFTTTSNTASIAIYCLTASFAGTYTFDKIRLNVGAFIKPFKPRNDDYLIYPNLCLSSSIDGAVYDTLSKRDGKYFKLSRFKTMDLSGDLPWKFNDMLAGVKRVGAPIINSINTPGTAVLAKYDGKVMANLGETAIATNVYDRFILWSDRNIYLDLNNNDTGWGDNYRPSPEEIQAYFYGWKMYDSSAGITPTSTYNRTDGLNKAWARYDKVAGWQGVTSLPTSKSSTGLDGTGSGYKLQYQLATPTSEEIAYEGGVTLNEGINQIEIGNGVIVREKTIPKIYTAGGTYRINNSYVDGHIGIPNDYDFNRLSKRASKIISVYSNGRISPAVVKGTDAGYTYGTSQADIPIYAYDSYSSYEVSYLALDQYSLTCNVLQVLGEYASNIKTTLDILVLNQTDIEARVGALEITKARKVQGQWITPTLLNGWVDYGDSNRPKIGYMKDEFGKVYLTGVIKNGSIGATTPAFYLPAGYRPTKLFSDQGLSLNGVACNVDIAPNGAVRILTGDSTFISLMNISFFIDQV
ncbi:hypothetical protein [Paenibacillus hamazuiensis]|uniref:hypothetical protein n=1 Tax=Paenibacillus hamazuiensis TaxID=2936508 RepID=UPI00200BF2E1|nr:hypothetical protein [Paenibacillus hamazuiensis]